MTNIVPVVLAGGSGTRLWPLSRKLYPKQFHTLVGELSLLQATLTRLQGVTSSGPIVVTGDDTRFLVAEQCRECGVEWQSIILEPQARNTAPAIGLAALVAQQNDPDAILVVLSSDHVIRDTNALEDAVSIAVDAVGEGGLLTFGITPEFANTQFGYIEVGDSVSDSEPESRVCRVAAFHEKPDQETAERFLAGGRHGWNSGMFVFRADSYLSELKRFEPEIFSAASAAVDEGQSDLDFFRPSATFADAPDVSIDYAVMEKTDKALVLPVDIGWSDIGSWSALRDIMDKDQQGNAIVGDVLTHDTKNSMLFSQSRLIAAVGVENVVAIETPDAVLISSRERAKDVGDLVKRMRAMDRAEPETHTEVYRPWGSYETIELAERYQVKRIRVKPGASLSLQMHHHRAEHWVVVTGTAIVQRDEEEMILSENESVYIPLGAKHRLTNPGKLPLEMIEVQVGSYLGEDDIVRFEDIYGRTPAK